MSRDLKSLQEQYLEFIEERGWESFHTPKNLAMAISVEASELVELYQWHDNVPRGRILEDEELRELSREELADVMLYCLSMANQLEIDIEAAIEDKLADNKCRYDKETAAEFTCSLQEWQR